ncbi:MAG: SDR family NAD(P)-dependent oxidoreductase [Chloroflexi bacterium]|nr:SDR family NAD(P)-dependent oxidoreductase [Chloroflexota bacterium]
MPENRGTPILPFLIAAGVGAWGVSRLIREARLRQNQEYFHGKVVIITGASRGIGKALALAFAKRGAHVVLAARSVGALDQVASACDERGAASTLVLPTDISDLEARRALIQKTMDHYHQIDILVNNAGIVQGGPVNEVGYESMAKQIEINLLALMHLTQLALPHMLERGRGHIVNVASLAGHWSEANFSAYAASKRGVIGFAMGLRHELLDSGIHVMTLNPSETDTDQITNYREAIDSMGIEVHPPEAVAEKALAGIVLRQPEVNVGGLLEKATVLAGAFPRLAALAWRVMEPSNWDEFTRQQRTE